MLNTSAANAAPAPPDPWDQPSTSANAGRRSAAAPAVPDDWDDDEDEPEEPDNQKIWEDANARAPMPQLVLAPSSTTQPPASLPPAVFQAPIRILKRSAPPGGPSPAPSGAGTPTAQSLAEREARYKAARERIFAEGGGEAGVVREPRGPEGEDAPRSASRGFVGRRKRGSGASSPRASSGTG